MISDLLLKFGLSEKEIAIYTALIQKGRATATELSRITKINRTTIYSVSKDLIEKGFISEDDTTTPSTFVPLPPHDLKTLIAKEEQHLQHRKNLVDRLIPELFSIAKGTAYSPPKIQFRSDEDFEEYLYKQSPIWTKSLKQYDGIWWGFQDPSFVEHYHEYISWHWKQPDTPGMILKLITTPSKVEEKLRAAKIWPEQRMIRTWPGAVNFTATTWVLGDYVVLAFTNHKPHYMIEIYDKAMAQNMRTLFQGIWETIPKNT